MATIVPRGKTCAVVYDYTSAEGEKKQKWESGLTKEEAEERKAEVEYLQKSKQFIPPSQKTVEEFMWEWVPVHARKKWTYKTYTGSVSLIKNHILPHIGSKPIQKVTRQDIDLLYDKLSKTPKGAYKNGIRVISEEAFNAEMLDPGKYLSSTTINEIHSILQPFFRKAVEYKLIRESPVPLEGPKKRDVERAIWDEEMMLQALSGIEDQPLLHLAIHCAYALALRNGEAMAITLDCIDLDRNRLYITKTLQRVYKEVLRKIRNDELIKIFPCVMEDKKSCLILKGPKTRQSKRYIFMPETLRQEIVFRMEQIQKNKERLGERYNDYGLLICLENGNPIEPKLIQKWFTDWQKSQDVPYPPLVFHGIRHSAATYKLELSDGDYKTVQGDTGHAQADVLLNKYGHIQDSRRQKLCEKFEQNFYHQKEIPNSPVNSNEQLFNLLLEKAQNDPALQATLFEIIKENSDLQRIALTAMVAQKANS